MTDEERRELARRAVSGDHEALLCLVDDVVAQRDVLERKVDMLERQLEALERELPSSWFEKVKESVPRFPSGPAPVPATITEFIVDSKTTRMASTPPPDRRDMPEYRVGSSSG